MKFDLKKLILPFLLILALIYIFLNRSCSGNNKIVKENTIVKYDTIYKPIELPSKTITKYKTLKGDVVYIKGKVDTVVVKEFEKAPDTTKTNMFTDAIKIRQYKQEFNDSLADVSIFAETKGELLKLAPTVKIKARLAEKKTVFALYAGGGMYSNDKLKLGYKLNLRLQNKKGDLFSASYDPINKVIFAEYDLRIINIKK
jgi:hypothetical protein